MEFKIPLNSRGDVILMRVVDEEVTFSLIMHGSQLSAKTDAESLAELSRFIDALVTQLESRSHDKN